VKYTVWEGTTYSRIVGEPIASPLDKTGGQIPRGNIFPLPGGEEAEHGAEIVCVEVGQLTSAVGKARHFTALENPGAS
jgi:hypothetical protein